MRVGIVCPYSLTLPGGVQGQVLALADELRNQGLDVRVLGPCDGPPPNAGVTPLGDSLPTAANGSVAPIAPDPAAQLRIIRALRDERFDIVNLHEPLAPGVTQTALLFKSQPLVGTFHAAGESAAYKWLNPVVRWLSRKLDYRCAVSVDAEKMAQHAVGGDYEVLFNGVNLRPFAHNTQPKTSEPTIFFIGRHEPRKGLAVLLDAMSELPSSFRLWIAGTGPETDQLRAKVAGDARIEWLGRISEQEKIDRLCRATVFCAPSLGGESFGVVLVEAMAAGTPVVASELAGYTNVARQGVDSVLVPPSDSSALAGAIRNVCTDSSLSQSLQTEGLRRAEDFSMTVLAQRYIEIFEDVLRKSGGAKSRR